MCLNARRRMSALRLARLHARTSVAALGVLGSVALSAAGCGGAEGPVEFTTRTDVGTLLESSYQACPQILALNAAPVVTAVGGEIELTANAALEEADELRYSYAWFAASGDFTNPSKRDTRYVCTKVGTQALSLFVTDGTCADELRVDVFCVDP